MTSRLGTALAYGILVAFCLFAILPILGIAFAALQGPGSVSPHFTPPTSPHWGNLKDAWSGADFGLYMRNSAIVTFSTIALAAPLAVVGGYAFGTIRFPGRELIFTIFLLGLVVPSETIIVPLYFNLRSAGLLDSYSALILPEAALFLAFGTFWMRAFFSSLPRSLFEAARIDGAPTWRTLVHVALPPARPAMLTMVVLFFMWSWNEFFLPLVMISGDGRRTAPLGLGLFIGQHTTDVTGLAAAAFILAAPIVVVYVLLQRHLIQGVISGSVKG